MHPSYAQRGPPPARKGIAPARQSYRLRGVRSLARSACGAQNDGVRSRRARSDEE
ncbi:MAG: hypothetical protein OJF49_001653 [Ktedonobacterales bacterium]|nr:MAG: hypothetical protein OJF49_001653 [Ktedonobacterales bacterium]